MLNVTIVGNKAIFPLSAHHQLYFVGQNNLNHGQQPIKIALNNPLCV